MIFCDGNFKKSTTGVLNTKNGSIVHLTYEIYIIKYVL
jgi:hypothetical protein